MKYFFTLLLLFLQFYLFSQNEISFGKFTGSAIFMPINEIKLGHGRHVYNNRLLGKYEIEKVNVTRQNVEVTFPGITQQSQFGLLLRSELEVFEPGCYEISLESDDGSMLWINKQLIIDNDSIHQMKFKSDTLWLQRGQYDANLWYYNALPEEYGLILDQKLLKDVSECDQSISNKTTPRKITADIDTFQLTNVFLFASGKYELSDVMKVELDSLCSVLEQRYFKEIIIEGFTDDIGSTQANKTLSINRAKAVSQYLSSKTTVNNKKISTFGRGEVKANESSNVDALRQENRNVRITIKR